MAKRRRQMRGKCKKKEKRCSATPQTAHGRDGRETGLRHAQPRETRRGIQDTDTPPGPDRLTGRDASGIRLDENQSDRHNTGRT